MPDDLKIKVNCYDLVRTVINYNTNITKGLAVSLEVIDPPEGLVNKANEVCLSMKKLGLSELGQIKLR